MKKLNAVKYDTVHDRGMERTHSSGLETGDRIRRARKAAGLTQAELARRVGVHQTAVVVWERAIEPGGVQMKHLIAIAQALGIRTSRLTDDEADDVPLRTDGDDEIALVSLYRQMSPRQKHVHLALFYIAMGVDNPRDLQANPMEALRIAS